MILCPYYKNMLKRIEYQNEHFHTCYDEQSTLKAAGYIEETIEDRLLLNALPDTNLVDISYIEQEYKKYEKQNKKFIVLISSGSYSPVHAGHINMFHLAKEKAEEEGYTVLGGLISPAHDAYVLNKYKEGRKFNITERISLIQENIFNFKIDSHFIRLSIWEAIKPKKDINFTTVLQYHKNMFSLFKENIDIGFIIGSDNKDFMEVFVDTDIKVFICPRPGYDIYPTIKGLNFFYTKDNLDISSTQIRKIIS